MIQMNSSTLKGRDIGEQHRGFVSAFQALGDSMERESTRIPLLR